jgi:hypothetical protein
MKDEQKKASWFQGFKVSGFRFQAKILLIAQTIIKTLSLES